MQRQSLPVAMVSADERLIQMAQASAAVTAAPLVVVTAPDDVRTVWRTAPVMLIGADQAARVATWSLPTRPETYLLGQADTAQDLCRWSIPLRAGVVLLPEGAKWLTRVVTGRTRGVDAGVVVAVWGGSGGVGASTLSAGLAVAATRASLSVALVDEDPFGGGLDLLIGAENTPGWRWDKLNAAAGQIADITSMLPKPDGITLVSMPRTDPAPVPEAAREAVVDALARTHDLVVVDAGRAGRATRGWATRSIVMSTLAVQSIAAARAGLGPVASDTGLVVRRRGAIQPADAARAVELPLVGVVPDVPELARLADRGVGPALGGKWRKACTRILRWCLEGQSR